MAGVTRDDFYCAFGTTRRKASSKSALHQIDCNYPTKIAARLRQQGVRQILLVSSVGAGLRSTAFYLRTKGQLEENMIGLNFAQTVITRPSFLIGARSENRPGEKTAKFFLKRLAPLMVGALRKYRGAQASAVAQCLVQEADARGLRFIESDKILQSESP